MNPSSRRGCMAVLDWTSPRVRLHALVAFSYGWASTATLVYPDETKKFGHSHRHLNSFLVLVKLLRVRASRPSKTEQSKC